jgi:hypothetical protein
MPASVAKAVDTTRQISGLMKLKLTKCAPIPGLPEIGFFMLALKPAGAARRLYFFL